MLEYCNLIRILLQCPVDWYQLEIEIIDIAWKTVVPTSYIQSHIVAELP